MFVNRGTSLLLFITSDISKNFAIAVMVSQCKKLDVLSMSWV
jgi:hypothetical protein